MGTNTCPTCGYIFAPFETSCPRCARAAARSTADAARSPADTALSRPSITPVRPMSRGFYLWSVVAVQAIIPVLGWVAFHVTGGNLVGAIGILFFACILELYGLGVMLSMIWKMWAAMDC